MHSRQSNLTACIAVLLTAGLSLESARGQEPKAFELHDGDRVVFLGDTLMEREQYHGWIELALTTRFPERDVTFRNLGWSADTPAGASRFGLSLLQAGHEPPDEGWRQLQAQLQQTKPTVVFLGYGMASSFAGEAGLPAFEKDLRRLLDVIQKLEPSPRIVVLSPIPHQPGPSPLPDPKPHNQALALYSAALRRMAAERKATFISLFDAMQGQKFEQPITDNGIHLNSAGYRLAARLIEQGLGWPAGEWENSPRIEQLRQVILRKNEQFFHRSRPANMAYIFGFRKAEQGRNAVEIPQFDPLIEAEEKKIAALRSLKPVEPQADAPPRTRAAASRFTPQPRPAFTIAPGLEVTLWAENPQLHKPIQMSFDPQGRLWIASSEVYPQIEPGQTANDKILILEDSDGDGKADQSTVFAEGLLIPTGLAPGDGGVYVAQSTELLHFKDSDGDGKADHRRIVLSGFGTEDTHHNLHTLRWGPDGRLWMNQSIYTRTDAETPHGVVRLKSGGVMRLEPRAMLFEVFCRGFWNSWGHQFDSFGQSFMTDGAGSSGINYGLPGAYFVGYARPPRVLDGISPGNYPKFCSLEIIRSQHFPPDWQGDMITCDFRANRIVRFRVTEEGAGYVAQEVGDVLRSSEVSFRPIDVQLGPDGALYVADWSNPIINHGEVDFRDPRRDREHGRIWRITVKDRPLTQRRDFTKQTNAALLDALLSANSYERIQARRVLCERGRQSVAPDLRRWLEQHGEDEAQLEGLWLEQALGEVDGELLNRVLLASDGRVRAAAVRLLADHVASFPHARDQLARALRDQHPRVRLEAIRALGRLGTADAADLALTASTQPLDRFLDYALWLTLHELADPWLEALAAGRLKVDGRAAELAFGLSAAPTDKAQRAVARVLEQQPLTRDGQGPWIELIGRAGGPGELTRLFNMASSQGFHDQALLRSLAALQEASRLRRLQPVGDLRKLEDLLASENPAVRTAAVRLAGRWKLTQATPTIAGLALSNDAPAPVRTAAIEALRELKGPESSKVLRELADNTATETALRHQALLALASLEPAAALPLIRTALDDADSPETADLWRNLLGVKDMGKRLSENLKQQGLPRGAARLGFRVVRDLDDSHRDLIRLLAQQAGEPEPRTYSAAELQQLVADARLKGDPVRGELVYRRSDLRCIGCHAIGGAGGKVGPDFTSLGASAPLDYLAESLVVPNRKVKEGYHAVVLLTADGQVVSGIPVRETAQEIILRNANDKEVVIPRADVAQRGNLGSLMPSGIIDPLSDQDRWDLLRFLGELGRPGPFDVTRSRSPRTWRLLDASSLSDAQQNQARRGDPSVAGWTALPTTLAGALLKPEVLAFGKPQHPPRTMFMATRFDLPRAGSARFDLGSLTPVQVWLDGRPVQGSGAGLAQQLEAGQHVLVLEVRPADLPEQFVLRSEEVVFLPGP